MAVNQYGIDTNLWRMMSPDDQNAVIAQWNAAHNVAYQPPAIGGYAPPPTGSTAATALQTVTATAPKTIRNNPNYAQPSAAAGYQPAVFTPAPGTTAASTKNPEWIYAVNMPSTYPDFAAMKAAGTGLIVADNDPNAAMLVAAARQWGVKVSVNIWADPGVTPEQYAAKVQSIIGQYNPDMVLLNIEVPGQGGQGSDQWNWSQQTASLLQPIVAGKQVAVTMEPHQLYNYQAWNQMGSGQTEFWPQTGGTSGSASDLDWALGYARAAGIPDSQIKPLLYPGQDPSVVGGAYNSYGIPTMGQSAAGVYGGPGTPTGLPGGAPQGPGVPAPGVPIGSGVSLVNAPPGGIPGVPYSGVGGASPPLPGASSAGAGSTGSGTSAGGTDWASAFFGSFGLPQDVISQVNAIFAKYPDTDQATQFALAYIRSTPWYAQTFPGIQYGMQHGMIANEQDYRQYVTSLDSLYQQYLGRHVSGQDVSTSLYEGRTPDLVGKQFQGLANVQANWKDYNYYLGNFGDTENQDIAGGGNIPSTDALRALGEEQAGLDSPLGQKMTRALNQALTRFGSVFQGSAATPSLSLSNAGRLVAPGLGAGKPDIAA